MKVYKKKKQGKIFLKYFICKSTNESIIVINIYKKYYAPTCFDTRCVILRDIAFSTFLNYISKIAAIIKINKIFKILKLSSVIKWLLLQFLRSLYGGRIYSLCVDVAVVPVRYVLIKKKY